MENVSPIDGRYKKQLEQLSLYFSEFAYIKNRVAIEIEYLIFLSTLHITPKINKKETSTLRKIGLQFDMSDAQEVKNQERITNHDMKSIEYFLHKKCEEANLSKLIPFIHWGITSDDTGNLAYSRALKECNTSLIIPTIQEVIQVLKESIKKHVKSPLMGRTHGQPAVPTTFGKEMGNYYVRLEKQLKILSRFTFEGKLMGAVGTLSAHRLAFPHIQWVEKSTHFVQSLGLQSNIHSTQILPADNWIAYFQTLSTINGIIRGLCVDMWTYIMLEEVQLKKIEGEVGSSTMPQKINPINFENAEGNCEIAITLFQMYERRLISSRLQRDLSDSIIKRTFGTALGHTLLAWKSVIKGLKMSDFNTKDAQKRLNSHYEIVTEALQTQLRLKNDRAGYEKVKALTRGKIMSKELFTSLVTELGLKELLNLTPEKYLGYAEELSNSS